MNLYIFFKYNILYKLIFYKAYMKRAVFIDRDGVIFEDKNHIHKKEDLEIIPGSVEAIKILNNKNYLVVVVTNQSVVARGLCNLEELISMNNYIEENFIKHGAVINKTYFCPHHPTEGTNPLYTRQCDCRKPKIGMIMKAKDELGVYLPGSYVVGDKTSDIKMGKDVGCQTILVKTGYGGKDNLFSDYKPDFISKNLLEASNLISI